MKINLTQSGKTFLAVAVLFYFSALTSQSSLLLMIVGLLLGMYLLNFIVARQSVLAVSVQAPPSVKVFEEERVDQPWIIKNAADQFAGWIEIESPQGTLLRVGKIAPNSSVSLVPELAYARRGVYRHAQLRVGSTFPFGLLKTWRRLELPGEVVVYPRIYETPPPRAAGFDAMVGGKFHGKGRTLSGANFAGVRPIQPGDPFKHIHWKSSAKGLGLMVKTFDEELSGRVAVFIDPGHSGNAETFEHGLRAAGSLMFSALDAGHHLEWAVLDHPRARLVPPFSDGQEILDALARLEIHPNSLTSEAMRSAVAQVSRKSALCFVLTEFTASVRPVISELRAQRRTVSVLLPEKFSITRESDGIQFLTYAAKSIDEQSTPRPNQPHEALA
ncbi:MAG: DUF58 domain-containing protein [Verrucomicrobiota bacterium]